MNVNGSVSILFLLPHGPTYRNIWHCTEGIAVLERRYKSSAAAHQMYTIWCKIKDDGYKMELRDLDHLPT